MHPSIFVSRSPCSHLDHTIWITPSSPSDLPAPSRPTVHPPQLLSVSGPKPQPLSPGIQDPYAAPDSLVFPLPPCYVLFQPGALPRLSAPPWKVLFHLLHRLESSPSLKAQCRVYPFPSASSDHLGLSKFLLSSLDCPLILDSLWGASPRVLARFPKKGRAMG